MWARKPSCMQLGQLYCQLLLLTCFGGWGLGAREARGQVVNCTNLLKGSQDLSFLQLCVSSSNGSPVVLDEVRRFEPPRRSPRPVLDLAFKSSTVLLLPPGALTEVVTATITGVRLANPASVVVQLLLAVSVQSSASLLLTDVTLETDCSTLLRYHQWIAETRSTSLTVLEGSGDVFVGAWNQSGVNMANCTISCRRPPTAVVSALADGAEITTLVTVSTDVELYNALALAASYGNGSVTVEVAHGLAMTSPLWAGQGVTLLRNLSIVGSRNGSSSGGGGGSSSVSLSGELGSWKPVMDLQDVDSGVYLADGVVLTLSNLTIANTAIVFAYAPVAYTGLGLVAPFLWFFDFKRTVLSATKPLIQLIVIDCDIISYSYDILHMWAWSAFLTSTVEPIASQAAPFRIGVYDMQLNTNNSASLEFTRLDAYGMLYCNTSLVPDVNSTANVTIMARGMGVPLYELKIPAATTAIAVWTHSDLQNVLALAQRPLCSPYSNTTTYIHLLANISLDGNKWPNSPYNISCNITISGSVNRLGGTWLNFNLLSRFIVLSEGATLTFRYLSLLNMPSQLRTYALGDPARMTLPLWPVGRSPGSLLLMIGCTVVLPYEEYRMLADVGGGLYVWPALNSSFKADSISPHYMSVTFLAGFNNLIITSTLITDASLGSVAYPVLLGTDIYGTRPPSPPPDGANGGHMPRSGVLAVAVATPLGVVVLAALAAAAVFVQIRRCGGGSGRGCGDDNMESSRRDGNSPEVPSANLDLEERRKDMGAEATAALYGGVSSNITARSEDVGKDITEGKGGEGGSDRVKIAECESDVAPVAPSLHVELHQLILDFAREIEDKHLAIHEALGSGGFATVYRGTWRGIDVAVKVIEFQDRTAGNERLQARAMTEAAIAANIQHANIVTTYSYDIRPSEPNDGGQDKSSSTLLGIGPTPGGGAPVPLLPRRHSGSSDQSSNGSHGPRRWKLYLIQEFCEVGSLRVAVENRMFQLPEGQPNMPMILRLMLDVVRGLQHLHRKNIVHGDLTPGNILLKANAARPGQYVAKLADFGLSVKMDPSQTSVDNNRTGTPFYASPEVRQHGNLTKASDVFALGVVLWEMWHGRPCYQRVRGVKHYIHATGYPSFPLHCPTGYADLASRCLRRELEERPQLEEVNDVLRNLLGSAVSGFSSGSEGGTSGSASHEWPYLAGMSGLGPGAGLPMFGGGGGGGGGLAAAAAAAAIAGGRAASEIDTAAGDGTGCTGIGSNTSSWAPAVPGGGFQAVAPAAAVLPELARLSKSTTTAAGMAATSPGAAPEPPPVVAGGAGSATAAAATAQQQRLPPHVRLSYGMQGPDPSPQPWAVGASPWLMLAAAAAPPPSPSPLPAPAELPEVRGMEEDGATLRNQLFMPAPVFRAASVVAQQGEERPGDAPMVPAGGGGLSPSPQAHPPVRASISLKLGTAGTLDEHFVTAPGSNG